MMLAKTPHHLHFSLSCPELKISQGNSLVETTSFDGTTTTSHYPEFTTSQGSSIAIFPVKRGTPTILPVKGRTPPSPGPVATISASEDDIIEEAELEVAGTMAVTSSDIFTTTTTITGATFRSKVGARRSSCGKATTPREALQTQQEEGGKGEEIDLFNPEAPSLLLGEEEVAISPSTYSLPSLTNPLFLSSSIHLFPHFSISTSVCPLTSLACTHV